MSHQTGFAKITALLLIAVLGRWGLLTWHALETFEHFLPGNKQLKQSLTRLSETAMDTPTLPRDNRIRKSVQIRDQL